MKASFDFSWKPAINSGFGVAELSLDDFWFWKVVSAVLKSSSAEVVGPSVKDVSAEEVNC